MKPVKVLFTSILCLSTLLQANGASRHPIAKKQFQLTYDDIKKELVQTLPERMLVVDFIITEQGKVENARIIDDVNIDISKTVISKVMTLKFKPALQNGRPVRVRYKLPIVFK